MFSQRAHANDRPIFGDRSKASRVLLQTISRPMVKKRELMNDHDGDVDGLTKTAANRPDIDDCFASAAREEKGGNV